MTPIFLHRTVRINILILIGLAYMSFPGNSQPTVFVHTPTNLSGIMIGQALVDGTPASSEDWIAAFSPANLCVGASQIIQSGGLSYFSLPIYGDDPVSLEVEGLQPGEYFTLRLYRAAEDDVLLFPSFSNPEQFLGWTNTNGTPMPGYNNPSVTYNFNSPLFLSIEVIVEPISCKGFSDGGIQLIPNGGVPPYSFSWSNGSQNDFVIGLGSGSYSCDIEDSVGSVISTGQILLTDPDELLISVVELQEPTCFADSDGVLSILVEGGLPPYNLEWNNGATSASLVGLTAGDYSLSVTDNLGCEVTLSQTITQPEMLTAMLSSTPVTSSGLNDGTATAVLSGGLPPYSFVWSDSDEQTTGTANGLSPGSYTVTIEDSNGCTLIETVQVDLFTSTLTPSVASLGVIYPNPTSELVCFNIESIASHALIQICNAQGVLVHQVRIQRNAPDIPACINISHLSPGIYFVIIDSVIKRQQIFTKL